MLNLSLYQGNLLSSSFRSLKDQLAPHVARLKSLTYNVDQEARWSAELVSSSQQQAHHEETTRLLKQGFSTSLNSSMLIKQLPFYNLPARRNPAFFGRLNELQRLKSVFKPQSPPKELVCSCIYGLSGAGKTQLALEYAHCHIQEYEAILWVAAETPVKISQAFTAFARGLGLCDPSLQYADQLKDIVLRWLFAKDKKGMTNAKKRALSNFELVLIAKLSHQTPGVGIYVGFLFLIMLTMQVRLNHTYLKQARGQS